MRKGADDNAVGAVDGDIVGDTEGAVEGAVEVDAVGDADYDMDGSKLGAKLWLSEPWQNRSWSDWHEQPLENNIWVVFTGPVFSAHVER